MTEKPQLTLYNSLTRQKEVFTPQDPKRVTMYNCGPTVYSYAHIGNARAAVVADVLFRVLRHIYGEDHVVYARNITDVDDKIIESAKEQGVDISVITEKYAKIYNEDLAAIGCLMPTEQPKATEHIQEMADIIVTLLDKDIAYEAEGHILFSPKRMDAYAVLHNSDMRYGQLSNRSLEDNLAGARVEVASYKRDPSDFVLWKPTKNDEPGWSQQESSDTYHVNWRNYANRQFANIKGRPGWHIECSAMAKATLCDEEYGDTIDIHCGGVDLKFPHHENEIAQSECANDAQFSKFWIHNEFLNMGSEKMSKSLGNVKLIHDMLKDWDGEVIRLALLKAHYRRELIWSESLLKESKNQLSKWKDTHRLALSKKLDIHSATPHSKYIDSSGLKLQLFEAVYFDLLTPAFFSVFNRVASNFRTSLKMLDNTKMVGTSGSLQWEYDAVEERNYWYNLFMAGANLLGLLQKDPEEWFKGGASEDDEARFDAIAKRREEARAKKDWPAADAARDEAAEAGIVLEDGPDGTTWRKA